LFSRVVIGTVLNPKRGGLGGSSPAFSKTLLGLLFILIVGSKN